MQTRTVGVEEEFLLVDPVDGRPRAIAAALLDAADQPDSDVEAELHLQQIETGTKPCHTIDELNQQVRAARRRVSGAARRIGVEIAAMGISPFPVHAELTPSPRYEQMARRFGMTVQDQLTCGCHVHVGVASDEEGVGVLDRVRPWLATFLALSANSPFYSGQDTSYASYRSQVWPRWPSTGPTELFGSAAVYHETVRSMVDSGTLLDPGMVYFDARLSRHYPTVEIRVADVCLHTDDTLLLAALARALVATAAREWEAGRPPLPRRVEQLRLANWRAGRSGMDAELVDPRTFHPVSAWTVLDSLVAHVREALDDSGEYAEVRQLREALSRRGNGARLQRAAYTRTGRLADVVADCVRRTVGG